MVLVVSDFSFVRKFLAALIHDMIVTTSRDRYRAAG